MTENKRQKSKPTGLSPARGEATQSAEPSFRQVHEAALEHLKSLGRKPDRLEGGNLAFHVDGQMHFVLIYEDDPSYLQLLRPSFRKVDSPEKRARALEAANATNLARKVVKVVVTSSDAGCMAEVFLVTPQDFANRFHRYMQEINEAVAEFNRKMDEA